MKKFRIVLKCAILAIAGLLWSEYEKNKLSIVKYKISSDKLKNDKRLVFLSDLHDKEFGDKNSILLEKIYSLKPDAILIGGDFTCTKAEVNIEKTLYICEELIKICPVYYGNGNHELRMKKKKYASLYEEFTNSLAKIGVKHLQNSNLDLDDNISVYGLDIDDKYYKRLKIPNMEATYIEERLGECIKDKYNILLAHSPNFFEAYREWGADLSLCGHFHGGTIRIGDDIGLMTPQIQFFNTNVVGMKIKGKSKMIISSGLGTHSINLRINTLPQIVCIDLESKNQE